MMSLFFPRSSVLNSNLSKFKKFSSVTIPKKFNSSYIPETKVSTLSNKFRVATEDTGGETATIGVWIDAGSAFENDKNNGVAHFLEHMAFKGTQNRSRVQLEKEIENMGGTLNAYTSREQTVYYAKVFKNDVPKAVDILSDILLNSKLEESSIEAERSTILREMEEVNKDDGEVIFDYLHSAAFQGTSLARTILGPEENIRSLKRNDLVEYIQTHYRGPKMVLAAAGGIKHEEVVALAEKSFSSLPGDAETFDYIGPNPFTGSQVTVRDETRETCNFVLAFESVGWSHPDYFIFMLLQTMIGNWDRTLGAGTNLSSRLCETIATHKLANSITTFNTCFKSTGLFGSYVVAPSAKNGGNFDDLTYVILNEWSQIAKNLSEKELTRAKNKLKAATIMQLDGTTAICEDIGRQMLTHGRRLTPQEIFSRIDAITTKDVSRVMQNHFEDTDPAVVAIGDTEGFPDYTILRERTYQRRW